MQQVAALAAEVAQLLGYKRQEERALPCRVSMEDLALLMYKVSLGVLAAVVGHSVQEPLLLMELPLVARVAVDYQLIFLDP